MSSAFSSLKSMWDFCQSLMDKQVRTDWLIDRHVPATTRHEQRASHGSLQNSPIHARRALINPTISPKMETERRRNKNIPFPQIRFIQRSVGLHVACCTEGRTTQPPSWMEQCSRPPLATARVDDGRCIVELILPWRRIPLGDFRKRMLRSPSLLILFRRGLTMRRMRTAGAHDIMFGVAY